MAERGVQTECWSPLVSGMLLDDSVYGEIARKHGRSPAQVVLRWHIQNGLVIIPKAERREWMEQNLSITEFTLDEEDVAFLDALDQGDAGRTGPHLTKTTWAEREALVQAAVAKLIARQNS
jgi:2,5-diketo-D-gluconate reductase A